APAIPTATPSPSRRSRSNAETPPRWPRPSATPTRTSSETAPTASRRENEASLSSAVRRWPAGGMRLLGALQVDTLARVHPDPLAFPDELGDLDRDSVAELGGLGAGGLGRRLHDRRGLDHLELGDRGQLDGDGATTQPLHLEGESRLQPLAQITGRLVVQGVLLVGARVHYVHPVRVPVEDLQLLGVEPGVLHELGGA